MKNILITGDSKGLGLETKKNLKNSGYNVIGISRSSNDIAFDLCNYQGIKELYLEKIKPLGPIHGFINNAAVAYDDIITNANESDLVNMYNVNVFSPIFLTKYVIRDMLLNKVSGSIVHVSSISAHTGYKGLAMYASTKGALEAFSKNTAREWGRFGIRSNIVCPGFMSTEMSESIDDSDKEKIFKRNSMFKELEVSQTSKCIEFLVSQESSGVTGQILHVDNGTI